ncbi:MAG: adenylate/guanylate cyclase domain-containing protein [Elusimicrobiota bacterium]
MKKISKIAIKFSGIVSAIILVIMSTMAFFTLKQTRDYFVKEMQVKTEFFARDVKESLFPKIDIFNLYFATCEMAKEKAILNAMVLDDKGIILSHSDKTKIGGKINITDKTFIVEEKGIYGINVPILIGKPRPSSDFTILSDFKKSGMKDKDLQEEWDEKNIGSARIDFSRESVNAALKEMRNKIILITVAILFASILTTILIVTIMIKPINILVSAAKKIGAGDLNQKIVMRRNDELGELTDTFNGMVKGLRDRDFIRNTFGKYVSKEIAETILNSQLKLGGERRKATVLFSDIRNFTSISEKLQPEEVIEFLNEYFAEMVSVITNYNGTLNKFIGDEILAVFGIPICYPNDAKRAILTAIEMQQKLKTLNIKRKINGKDEIDIGIGIHTGNLVVGNIGTDIRMEYTVIGDTVNLASRIETLNKQLGTQILISECTYKEVSDMVVAREIPSVSIKGKEEQIKVYEILNKIDGVSLEQGQP